MATRCGVPHPRYSSYTCRREPNHGGNHHGRRGNRARIWAPYLSTFHALTAGLTRR